MFFPKRNYPNQAVSSSVVWSVAVPFGRFLSASEFTVIQLTMDMYYISSGDEMVYLYGNTRVLDQ